MAFPKGKTVLFFYKGSTFPEVIRKPDYHIEVMKLASEMIVLGLQHGVSLTEQKADYVAQLDLLEKSLHDASNGRAITKKSIKKAVALTGGLVRSPDHFNIIWCLNICALLKMNVIKDDNDNGMVYIEA